MTKADKIWLACFIDTEGSILVSVENTKKEKRKFCVSIRPILSCSMTEPAMLEKAKQIAGGFLSEAYFRNTSVKKNCKVYDWKVRGFSKVIPVIKDIYPYLLLKKDKAKVIIELGKLYDKLIKRSLRKPRPDRNQFVRKRLGNRETHFLLDFLVKNWYPKFGQDNKSFQNSKDLLDWLRNN